MSTNPFRLVEGLIAIPLVKPFEYVPMSFGREWMPLRLQRKRFNALYAAGSRTVCMSAEMFRAAARWNRDGGDLDAGVAIAAMSAAAFDATSDVALAPDAAQAVLSDAAPGATQETTFDALLAAISGATPDAAAAPDAMPAALSDAASGATQDSSLRALLAAISATRDAVPAPRAMPAALSIALPGTTQGATPDATPGATSDATPDAALVPDAMHVVLSDAALDTSFEAAVEAMSAEIPAATSDAASTTTPNVTLAATFEAAVEAMPAEISDSASDTAPTATPNVTPTTPPDALRSTPPNNIGRRRAPSIPFPTAGRRLRVPSRVAVIGACAVGGLVLLAALTAIEFPNKTSSETTTVAKATATPSHLQSDGADHDPQLAAENSPEAPNPAATQRLDAPYNSQPADLQRESIASMRHEAVTLDDERSMNTQGPTTLAGNAPATASEDQVTPSATGSQPAQRASVSTTAKTQSATKPVRKRATGKRSAKRATGDGKDWIAKVVPRRRAESPDQGSK